MKIPPHLPVFCNLSSQRCNTGSFLQPLKFYRFHNTKKSSFSYSAHTGRKAEQIYSSFFFLLQMSHLTLPCYANVVLDLLPNVTPSVNWVFCSLPENRLGRALGSCLCWYNMQQDGAFCRHKAQWVQFTSPSSHRVGIYLQVKTTLYVPVRCLSSHDSDTSSIPFGKTCLKLILTQNISGRGFSCLSTTS